MRYAYVLPFLVSCLSISSVKCIDDAGRNRRLDEEFYKGNKNVPCHMKIATVSDLEDEEDDSSLETPIHSKKAAANATEVKDHDLATEPKLQIELPSEAEIHTYSAIPGPSELSAILEPDEYESLNGHLARSHKFWYGEEEEEEEESGDGRRLGEEATKNHTKFRSSCNILKFNTKETSHEFVSGSVITKDRIIDITTLPNGEISFEVTNYEEFEANEENEHDDPPNQYAAVMYQNALELEDQEEDRRLMSKEPTLMLRRSLSKKDMIPTMRDIPPFTKDEILTRGLQEEEYAYIDVVVIYTRRAMCAQAQLHPNCDGTADNRAPIEARIELAVAESNTAFLLSGTIARLRLVNMELDVLYDDSVSFGNILGEFKARDDKKLDQIHTMRDLYGGDLAVLVVENTNYCGLGYMFNGNKEYGFSVTSRKCMTGYYSFGHELSHNMGCNHDRRVSPTSSPYAHGYLDPEGDFRTVMSYNCPNRCPRINRFSNPDLIYSNQTIGSENENNAKQINSAAHIISSWYAEGGLSASFWGQGGYSIPPTSRPNSEDESESNTGLVIIGAPECNVFGDIFGIRAIYSGDPGLSQNNWFSRFKDASVDFSNTNPEDERLQFSSKGNVSIKDGELTFDGAGSMSIAKAENSHGFIDVEYTLYTKFTKDNSYFSDTMIVMTVRANKSVEDTQNGCDANSYMVLLNRKTGDAVFLKMYFKRSWQTVTSAGYPTKVGDLPNGVPLDTWVGLKFVVYSQDMWNVKLELYVDTSGGEYGGDWKLAHQMVDSNGYWKAYRGWHYPYFYRSPCSALDGKVFLGPGQYALLETTGSGDSEIKFKNISVRNIMSKAIASDLNCFDKSMNKMRRDINDREEEEAPVFTDLKDISVISAFSQPDGCDIFGITELYVSSEVIKNDWIANFEGDQVTLDTHKPQLDDRVRLVGEGEIEIGDGIAMFKERPRMFVKKYTPSDGKQNEGFKNVEITGYVNYANDGKIFKTSGPSMIAPTDIPTFLDPCASSYMYTATIKRKTGEAVFNKIFWSDLTRGKTLKAHPLTVQISGFEHGIPTDKWIGMKFVILNEDETTHLELYIDESQGENGGDWKLVHSFKDSADKWEVNTSSPYFAYAKGTCGDKLDFSKPLKNSGSYVGFQNIGSADTSVFWKDLSIREISSEKSENKANKCILNKETYQF